MKSSFLLGHKGLFPFLTILILFITNSAAIGSDKPYPRTPATPVTPPAWAATRAKPDSTQMLSNGASLPPLKAVVFVGPIDGNTGSSTLSNIQSAKLTAAELRKNGVTVYEVYPNEEPHQWEKIKAYAEGANFLIYRGHGVYWSDMPSPVVGGFALNDSAVSNDDIRNDLHLAKNAIVMLYGCFTAGSAGNDTSSISLAEAQRRVAMYSHPFLDIGVGGYYADWFDDAFTSYVRTLFSGKTQRQAYEGFSDYDSSRMWRGQHPDHTDMAMWLGWDDWYDPKPQYNNAFVGNPDTTLADLFVTQTEMVISPKQIMYLATPTSAAKTFTIQVNSSTNIRFDWTASATATPAWLNLIGLMQGSSGQSITLQVDPSKGAGSASTVIRFDTTSPNVMTPSQDVSVSVVIVPKIYTVIIPVVIR